jgi:predicted nucleic acid-binding protein
LKAEDVRGGVPLLVDTDVFSFVHTQRGPWEDFAPFLQRRVLAVSFVTVAEVWYGARKDNWGEKKCKALEVALGAYLQIAPDVRVSMKWADIARECLGQLSGDKEAHDLWIAACALVFELPLVTNNLGDFQVIAARFVDLELVHPSL